MSGTFPTTPAPTDVEIVSVTPTYQSVMHSLSRQARSRGGQRWGFRLAWNAKRDADFRPLWAFIIAQEGRFETFSFQLPTAYALGALGGTPLVAGGSQTGRSIDTDGWPNSTTVLKAGDFVQFGGHAKTYMVTADVTSSGTGTATLSIFPPLVTSPADNAAVSAHTQASPLSWTVSMASDEVSVSALKRSFWRGLRLELQEVV